MRRMVAGLVAALVVASLAAPAVADRRAKADGNDTRGPLDIARIVHRHREAGVFVHKIVMQDAWRRRALRSTSRAGRDIRITFDVRRRVGYPCSGCISEREVIIHTERGRLEANLYNHLGDPPRHLTRLPVWRPDRRSVAFSVTRRQLAARRVDSYSWGVVTFFEREGDGTCSQRRPCGDVAPNDRYGLIRHRF